MNREQLLQEIKRIILENAYDELVSLYVMGSFLSNEMVESSDIDLIGVMKSTFDFRREVRINKMLNEKIRPSHRIDLGTMSYDEFFGGTQRGSLMKHIELHIFLAFMKRARLIYGKRINFDKFPVKPASREEQLEYHIRVFNEYKADFRKKNRIRTDFTFRDFIKIVFYIANIELQLARNLIPRRSYAGILKAFRNDRNHIVHYSMKLRCKKTISRKEKESWLDLAEDYVAKLKTRSSSDHYEKRGYY
jgi:predicted nucleotidyltransferase